MHTNLVISVVGGANLGKCYEATYFEVKSSYPLNMKKLHLLREAGFLGYGQEFIVKGLRTVEGYEKVPEDSDWTYKPTPSGHDTRLVVGSMEQSYRDPYYVYVVESRVDSSD